MSVRYISVAVAIVVVLGLIAAIYYAVRASRRKQRIKLLKELRGNYKKAVQSENPSSIRAAGRLYYNAVGNGFISENNYAKIEFTVSQVMATVMEREAKQSGDKL